MKELTEGAFAKVNLTLDVLDKREDGYHNLRSIMQTVSLHDDVHVTVGCEGWQIHCYREVLPPDADENTEPELVTCGLPQDRENLAWKAAEAFYARIGKKPEGLEIFINKRIPLEAGLGGGSADAAAVLRALNRAYDSPLSIPALCELGADYLAVSNLEEAMQLRRGGIPNGGQGVRQAPAGIVHVGGLP